MRKLYRTVLLFALSLPLLLVGCMRENEDDCVTDDNLILRFAFSDDAGADKFDQAIDLVDVFVFGSDLRLVSQTHLTKSDLNAFRGVHLTLKPGDYRVVCWGNVKEHSQIQGVGTRSIVSGSLTFNPQGGGDPVHFAPSRDLGSNDPSDFTEYNISIPRRGIVDEIYDFMPLYRSVSVYVKGMQDVVGGQNLLPWARITNMPPGYDFLLNLTGDATPFEQAGESFTFPDGEVGAKMQLYTSLFDLAQSDVDIQIMKSSDNSLVHAVNLDTYLTQYPPADEYEIEVLVKFISGSVEITAPDWNSSPVVPDL